MFFTFTTYALKICRWVFFGCSLLALAVTIRLAERKYNKLICNKVNIHVMAFEEQRFINEKEAYHYLLTRYNLLPNHTLIKDINAKQVENVIKSHKFVRFCSVYKSLKGVLNIIIWPKRAIARLMQDDGSSCYINELGETMPLSDSYTPRVVLVSIKDLCMPAHSIQLKELSVGKSLLVMLDAIDKVPFWKAQITHINVDKDQELTFSVQLSNHRIYFGKVENIERKMEKLKLVYNTILPYKGWNVYKKITLKFDNQIVCE